MLGADEEPTRHMAVEGIPWGSCNLGRCGRAGVSMGERSGKKQDSSGGLCKAPADARSGKTAGGQIMRCFLVTEGLNSILKIVSGLNLVA